VRNLCRIEIITGIASKKATKYTYLNWTNGIWELAKNARINPPKSGANARPINVADEYKPNFSPLEDVYALTIIAETTGPKIAVAVPWKNRIGINHAGELTIKYNRGAIKNTIPATINNFLRPILSDSIPIGKLNKIPASGENAEIKPMIISLPPNALTYSGNTGLFEMVVENIAKKPINDKK